MSAEIIIHNARIITMAQLGARAEAVALGLGRILAVGSGSDVLALADTKTRIIDANGATVLPGFVESHMHLFFGAYSQTLLHVHDVTGLEELAEAVKTFASKNPNEPLLIGQGTSYALLADGGSLDRHMLDAICADRPLLLQSVDFHNAWCNTAALLAADILRGRDVGDGSEIEIGVDGLATGLLKEFAAMAPVLAMGSLGVLGGMELEGDTPLGATPQQHASYKKLLKQGLDHCASKGITTIINMDGNRYQADRLKEIEAEGDLTCRMELPFHFTAGHPLSNLEVAEGMREILNSDMLWCSRIKLFMDGVMDMKTAFRLTDYPGQLGERGTPLFSQDEFNAIAIEADRRGYQIAVHTVGDGAVRAVLDGYEVAQMANGKRDSRHRLEHIELISAEDIPRLAKLGVVASVQPLHPPGCAKFPLEPTISIIGQEQWKNAYLWKTLKQAGAAICFASDWPIAELEPLTSIEAALGRTTWRIDLPDERLSFEETLHAYTAGGAYAAKKEKLFGTIAKGMAADIVVLNKEISATDFMNADVAMTICAGRVTFDAKR